MARLVTHSEQTDSGWWEMSTCPPSPALRGLVSRYVGYREHALLPVRRREVPNGQVALILSFGPSIRVFDPSRPDDGERPLTSFVAAVGGRWAETEYLGEQYGLQIDVSPLAAGMILGTRMGEFGGVTVDLDDALGAAGRGLVERLVETRDWTGRFDLVDAFLLSRLAKAHAPSPAAAWAWRRLRETEGAASVAGLAEQLGCSTRYLSAQVRAHVGVPPKLLARILRVQHAIRLLDSSPASLSTIAGICGYADQAHLGRDFLDIAGVSPGRWAAGPLAPAGSEQVAE